MKQPPRRIEPTEAPISLNIRVPLRVRDALVEEAVIQNLSMSKYAARLIEEGVIRAKAKRQRASA